MKYYQDKFYQSISNFDVSRGYPRRKAYHVFINNIQFPVPPSTVTTTLENKNEVVDLANGGELNIIKLPGLTEIKMDLILPAWTNALHAVGFDKKKGLSSQGDYLNLMEKLKAEGTIFELAVLKPLSDIFAGDTIFELCTLEDYEILEDARNVRDITLICTFKKYVPPDVIKLEVKQEAEAEVVAEEVTPEPVVEETVKEYRVVAGDTLSAIAARFLGSADRFREIAAKNNIANPNLIYVGQVLKIG